VTFKEIKERFNKVKPVDKWDTPLQAALYYDFLKHAKEDIQWLISRVNLLEDELAYAKMELTELKEYYRKVIEERCPTDEKHCTCVPALRFRIKELEKVNL
jgi:hypothetical protein